MSDGVRAPGGARVGDASSDGLPEVEVLTSAQAHALFEARSWEWLGLSRVEFLAELDAGGFAGRECERPVRDLLALLGFARAT